MHTIARLDCPKDQEREAFPRHQLHGQDQGCFECFAFCTPLLTPALSIINGSMDAWKAHRKATYPAKGDADLVSEKATHFNNRGGDFDFMRQMRKRSRSTSG